MANDLQTKLDAILADKNTNLLPENLKSGVTLLGVEGTMKSDIDTSDATVIAEDIIKGKTAYANGEKITGTLTDYSNELLGISMPETDPYLDYCIKFPSTVENGKINNGSWFRTNKNAIAEFGGITPEKIVKGNTIFDVAGTAEIISNVICTLNANTVKYFIDNHGMRLNDSNQSGYVSSIVNKRTGETLVIEQEHRMFPQNVYGIKIKSYDVNTGKVEYELPTNVDVNNNMHLVSLPSTWQVGDKLDFYINLYVDDMMMNSISLPVSFIFKDIELIYVPSMGDAEDLTLTGNQMMTVTSNYSIGDSITISPLNMNSSWAVGQTMHINGLTSNSWLKEGDTSISIPLIYKYSNTPTPFLVGTITNIDTTNKKVTLTITQLNMLYTEYLNSLTVDNTSYTHKDKWLPSFSTSVASTTGNTITLQKCYTEDLPNYTTQAHYYDSDNTDKTITRTNTYTDKVTGVKNSTKKFGTFIPE